MAKKKEKRVGRPPKSISEEQWGKVSEFFEAGSPIVEVAAWLGIDRGTFGKLFKEKYGENYGCLSDFSTEKKSKGNAELRLKLHKTAKSGDKATLIFSAKNRLGMSDRPQEPQSETVKVDLHIAGQSFPIELPKP